MASTLRPSRAGPRTPELAKDVVRAIYAATDGQPRRWRMLSGIRGAGVEAVRYAVDQGWIEIQGDLVVCLTEKGTRLMAKEAH